MELGLKGCRAIVTGGSRGIGLATARAFADEGVDVAVCARGHDGLERTVADLRSRGVRAQGSAVDVAARPAYLAWLDAAVTWLGGLDIFVANASAMVPAPDLETAWSRFFEVDLMHAVRGLEHLIDALADESSGTAVLVSSASAMSSRHSPGPAHGEGYSAMKLAMLSYAAQKAQQLGMRGVRVNTVTPGTIHFEGGIWDQVRRADPARFEQAENASAMRRMGRPDEVASAVVYLASDAAAYVTGANLRVDGGVLESIDD